MTLDGEVLDWLSVGPRKKWSEYSRLDFQPLSREF